MLRVGEREEWVGGGGVGRERVGWGCRGWGVSVLDVNVSVTACGMVDNP